MIAYFFTPPGLYILIAIIFILSLIAYWKREAIKRELRRWRGKEVEIGPVKFERQNEEQEDDSDTSPAGIEFGRDNDFSRAKIKNVAGRNVSSERTQQSRAGAPHSVDFGEENKYNDAEIENVAGHDLEHKD